MLPTTLAALLVSFLEFFTGGDIRPHTAAQPLLFELRHEHAVSADARVVFADIQRERISAANDNQTLYTLGTRPVIAHRPPSFDAYSRARAHSMRYGQSLDLPWDEDEILGPNIESRETLLELAKMTNNAYYRSDENGWYELPSEWSQHYAIGWEPESDGFRGYVFATSDNSTVVLSIKGTSAGLLGGGPTSKKDKLNDNLLFSCCCARVDWTWTTVCGCYRGGWKCDQTCLEKALIEDSLFYSIGTNLYNNLTYMYPHSNIWIIGHSLGGALASLLGVTFGSPVVTFEAPGEKMAAKRLHLPSPPSTQHITHVYHTADPIPMGTCNGVLSTCALGGYAMESHCHLGKSIVYDTVSNLSWAVDIRTHSIMNIVEKLLSQPWKTSEDMGREVPVAEPELDCVECYSWEFDDFSKK